MIISIESVENGYVVEFPVETQISLGVGVVSALHKNVFTDIDKTLDFIKSYIIGREEMVCQ